MFNFFMAKNYSQSQPNRNVFQRKMKIEKIITESYFIVFCGKKVGLFF